MQQETKLFRCKIHLFAVPEKFVSRGIQRKLAESADVFPGRIPRRRKAFTRAVSSRILNGLVT